MDDRLAHILAEGRGRYNYQFLEARQRWPELRADEFQLLLEQAVLPVVQRAADCAPQRAGAVLDVLYDLALELLGRRLLGPQARLRAIAVGWEQLLPRVVHLLVQAPRLVAGALSNALFNLERTPGARPAEWAAIMGRAAEQCEEVSTWLLAGQAAAWRAGMAHYRQGALALCGRLPEPVARDVLDLPARVRVDEAVMRWRTDPWWSPQATNGDRRLAVVAQLGAFRGFGGPFLNPPRVQWNGGGFVVQDSQATWTLHADRFGAVLLRAIRPVELLPAAQGTPFALLHNGVVSFQGRRQTFSELRSANSWAANSTTLVATSPLSHRVVVLAWIGGGE